MSEPKYVVSEQAVNQMTEALSNVNAMTARIDERVKSLVNTLEDHDAKLEKIVETNQLINQRVTILESKNNGEIKRQLDNIAENLHNAEIKVAALEIHHVKNEGRWGSVLDFGIKVLFAVAACFIIYKLGLALPPLP